MELKATKQNCNGRDMIQVKSILFEAKRVFFNCYIKFEFSSYGGFPWIEYW